MKYFLALLLVCLTGCGTSIKIDLPLLWSSAPARPAANYPQYEQEWPTVNLETALRQQNWRGSMGEGSCVYATMVMLFRWQGRFDLADLVRKKYGNGTGYLTLAEELDEEGVRYAYTWLKKDVSFLEWACSTRRGCGVALRRASHMVMLVHLDAKWAGLLDNNFPTEIKWVPRDEFLEDWFSSYSWAVVPLMGPPPPPLPYSEKLKAMRHLEQKGLDK